MSSAKTGPVTRPTSASVAAFLEQVPDQRRRADCHEVLALMQQASGAAPVMWGPAIVGFGAYKLRYANGDELDWPVIAFSPRKTDLTLYIAPEVLTREPLMQRLGKVKTGKTCLYIKRLADVDSAVLREVIAASLEAMADKRAP